MKKKISSMKVFGLNAIHENTSIQFNSTGLKLSSGVNVDKKTAFALTYGGFEGQIFKGQVMQVYRRSMQIHSQFINIETIKNVQKYLIKQAQDDIKKIKL